MKAFHNDPLIRDKYIARVHEHAKMDEFVKGQYWQDGKGCAVGCTIHSDDHAAYETELGIPEWLARVEDCFFENLPNENAKEWPVKFLEAVNIGSDLEKIKAPFMIYILEQAKGNFDHKKYPDVLTSINTVQELWAKHPEGPSAAESAAESAAWSAESAARSAARSAAESAAWSAWSAARSAAESAAESAAWSAESAARSAAESAARSAARSAAFIKYSEHLLDLMRECK